MDLHGIPAYIDWDGIAGHCVVYENLTDAQKQRCREAFRFLNSELGHIPSKVRGKTHPLWGAQFWSAFCLWACDFADAIRMVRSDKHFYKLRKRLKDPGRFGEARSVLEAVVMFRKTGFQIELEPDLEINGRKKVPDLKLVNPDTGEAIFCEVTISESSDKEKLVSDTDMALSTAISAPGVTLHFSGRMYSACSREELEGLRDRVKRFCEDVAREPGFGTLEISGVLILSVSTESHTEWLKTWAAEMGAEVDYFGGPPVEVDRIRRTLSKATGKRWQLPNDHANLVLVEAGQLLSDLGTCSDPQIIPAAARAIAVEISKWPHICAVLIKGEHIGSPYPNTVKAKSFSLRYHERYPAVIEEFFLVLNPYPNPVASASTLSKIEASIAG